MLTDWLTARACRYEGEGGGSCTLNTPTHCIVGSPSTSPMPAMPFWGAGLLFAFGKFTGERKKFFWHWHSLFDQKHGFSPTTKNIWRNSSVWRTCISFLMRTAMPSPSCKTLKKERALSVQDYGQMIDISSVLGEMHTLPLHDTVTSAEQVANLSVCQSDPDVRRASHTELRTAPWACSTAASFHMSIKRANPNEALK